ncbi:Y-family DNA polymerase [Ructibacterium gallinarum]|uniref:DNA methylase n=1 Tax=Ructibacterium gallinarum TaxID=2779355 RepID=A0A9D5M5F2_9FIRM|nr:DNA methylase [Ructibacterium gallinarum]MBE5040940.1 DNA methylase [Ructibacterium gallinarum]
MENRSYVAIDLKSFYASAECVERGLDPLTTNLVVADESRTTKTICLAVSPSLKEYGLPGRARLFEVVQKIKEENAKRRQYAPGRKLTGASYDASALGRFPELAIDYIIAPPRMAHYIDVSAKIYQVYLKYIAPEDIHVYSIDEVFMDVTNYLKSYALTAKELTRKMILDVYQTTGITATAGIGTNLYLCKVAMDIEAKHTQPDLNGVRIAELDEISYRHKLWNHRPLTDFWRVGRGYATKLEAYGMRTMGDIARCSVGKSSTFYNEELLYKMFGINAELLIDHAWGWESCTMADIKAYQPSSSSLGSGQVLHCPYPFDKAKLVVREMTDSLVLDLVEKGLVTDQLTLTIGYDSKNLENAECGTEYRGAVTADFYGRKIPRHAHGTVCLRKYTSSTRLILKAVTGLFDEIADKSLLVRRLNVTAHHLKTEAAWTTEPQYEQVDFFTDTEEEQRRKQSEAVKLEREKRIQEAVIHIKKQYGKNAVLKGMNLQEGATGRDRNNQIGGHKA